METCIVGCKLPHGLIVDLNPTYDDKGRIKTSDRLTLKGANSAIVMGGFGVTQGVPREAFQAWVVEHKASPYVMNGSVFVVTTEASARAQATEKRTERTGFEQIDPAKKSALTAGLDMDPAALKALAQQRAENPMLARQTDVLDQ